MKIFLFLGSRRGHAVLKKLLAVKAEISGILCLIEDAHEEQYHLKITALAQENGIPIFYSNQVKPANYADLLTQIQPDIAFAIGWRYLITEAAYRIPKQGTLIIHDSLLPKYRGFAPMNWAIINGETKTGVTLFYIADGIDSGPIVDQLETEIGINDTAKSVDERLIKLYEDIIIKNLPALATNKAQGIPQNEALASYCCKRTPEDGEINWRMNAMQIHNFIRGLTQPFPGAFTFLQGKKIYIWAAQLSQQHFHYAGNIPGRILGKHNGHLEVLTGNGILSISRMQFFGEEEKDARDFVVSVKDTFYSTSPNSFTA